MAIWKRLKKYRNMDVEREAEEKLTKLEKGDKLAMFLSAFLVLWLPCLLILGGLALLVLFLFRAI